MFQPFAEHETLHAPCTKFCTFKFSSSTMHSLLALRPAQCASTHAQLHHELAHNGSALACVVTYYMQESLVNNEVGVVNLLRRALAG